MAKVVHLSKGDLGHEHSGLENGKVFTCSRQTRALNELISEEISAKDSDLRWAKLWLKFFQGRTMMKIAAGTLNIHAMRMGILLS